jgi:putative membrane protein
MLGKTTIAVIFSILLCPGIMFAQQKQQTTNPNRDVLSSADRNFVSGAEEANLAEIETAKMLEQKATDPAVKDFASRMVTDHTQASQRLATLAKDTGVTLPTQPSATERSQKSELQKLSGSKLEDAYLRDELQGHKQVISSFENEIEHGQDRAVRDYAEQTLPTLQDHIRIAEDLAGKMGMSGKAGLNEETKAIAAK